MSTGEGYICVAEDEDPMIKLCEMFAAQGCNQFALENGVLYLRWPDGKEQKVVLDLSSGETLQ